MSERSGDWGAGLCLGVGLVLAAGAKAKTMSKLIKHTDRVIGSSVNLIMKEILLLRRWSQL